MSLDTAFASPLPQHLAGEQLEAAFNLFNQLSQQLTQSYGVLEKQTAQLSGELAEARNERIKQLAEKEQLANRLEVLLNTLPASVVVLDETGRVNQFNLNAQSMFGSGLLGMVWDDIAQRHFLCDGDGLRLRNGRWVSLYARPIVQEREKVTGQINKETTGKIILITDVTETHQLEASLNHQRRLTSLGEMVASLAHQIRTPLSSALLYVSNINHPNANCEDRQRFSNKATDSLRHLERMVNDMLIFARGGVTENESFTVGELMTQLQHLLAPQFTKVGAHLRISNAASNVFLQGNCDALVSAFQNLASNALEAGEKRSDEKIIFEIKVNKRADRMIEFTFKDNGCGISEEIRARILEPFFTTRSSGTGLGLAVLNETVINHHGRLDIHSQQGEGSCFTITLPTGVQHTALNSELLNGEIPGADVDVSGSADVCPEPLSLSSYDGLNNACRILYDNTNTSKSNG